MLTRSLTSLLSSRPASAQTLRQVVLRPGPRAGRFWSWFSAPSQALAAPPPPESLFQAPLCCSLVCAGPCSVSWFCQQLSTGASLVSLVNGLDPPHPLKVQGVPHEQVSKTATNPTTASFSCLLQPPHNHPHSFKKHLLSTYYIYTRGLCQAPRRSQRQRRQPRFLHEGVNLLGRGWITTQSNELPDSKLREGWGL